MYGPTLTERITEGILGEGGVFAHDWKARVNHPLSQRVYVNRGGTLPRTPPDVLAKDVGPGRIYSSTDWEMTAAPAEHVQPYLDKLAYRLDSPECSLVFTGDTEPCQSVVALAKDADVMLCMCWDDQEVMERNGEARGQCGTAGRGPHGAGSGREEARARPYRPAPAGSRPDGGGSRRHQEYLCRRGAVLGGADVVRGIGQPR